MLNQFELTHRGETLRAEKILPSRVEEAAGVLNRAFAIWADAGFKPHSIELATSYLLPDGYAVIDSNNQIVGTFCVREARPRLEGDTVVIGRAHRVDRAKLHDKERFLGFTRHRSLIYCYGFSVDPERGKAGLGRALLRGFERTAIRSGHHGFMLETAKESTWLVDWYKKLGFEVVGESEQASPRTIMMLKMFDRAASLAP
jgi:ribosomal protein S18 acetylase RimI-like enzyme